MKTYNTVPRTPIQQQDNQTQRTESNRRRPYCLSSNLIRMGTLSFRTAARYSTRCIQHMTTLVEYNHPRETPLVFPWSGKTRILNGRHGQRRNTYCRRIHRQAIWATTRLSTSRLKTSGTMHGQGAYSRWVTPACHVTITRGCLNSSIHQIVTADWERNRPISL